MDVMSWIEINLVLGIRYKKCIYDSSKKETYEYQIQTHCVVDLLDSKDPTVQQWLDIMGIRGFTETKCDKKNQPCDPESYCTLYKSTTLTIRQHLEMFKRDSKQCNYNTVNHGTKYGLIMSQSQYDLLKHAYLNDNKMNELTVRMIPVPDTNAISFIDKDNKYWEKDVNGPYNKKEKRRSNQCEIS